MTMTLTACAIGPDFKSPEPPAVQGYLPGQTVTRAIDVPGRWWEKFRSAQLNRLVEDGLTYNTDLQAAEAAVRAAQANALAQRGGLFPSITTGFGGIRERTPTGTLDTNAVNGAGIYNLYTPQVTVGFTPDVFGGIRRSIESAQAIAELQAFQREGVYLTLSSNIALAAIQEGSLRGQIAATQRLIELQNQSLNILKLQNERGQIAMPDVVAQETAVAQARLLLPGLEKQLGQQRNLLAYLTGRVPSDATFPAFQLASFRLPSPLPRAFPADLIRQRPDVRAAEANLRSFNAQIGVAMANRLPQFTLTANAGSTALTVGKLFAPETIFASMAGNAAQTIFDAGSLEQKQVAAEAQSDQALALYRSAVLAAFRNVADVLRALETDNRALNAAIAAETSANRSIELARTQIERGQVAISVVIVAQQAYLQASLARVQAQAARLANIVALYQALGGGWWNRPPVNGPAVLIEARGEAVPTVTGTGTVQ
jgi:NodT family efflux transporter outer membrane factor (OMF) lipoprotein